MRVSKYIQQGTTQIREAGGDSWLSRKMTDHLLGLKEELRKVAQKYTGDTKYTRAGIKKTNQGVEIRLWLQMDEKDGRADAQELMDVLVGKGGSIGTHKLVPHLWVGVKVVPTV